MSRPDWPSIKRDYVETPLTLAEVQAKWGVKRGTLSARATRENWHDQKQQFAAKLEATRREKSIAKRAAAQIQFENGVVAAATVQLGLVIRELREPRVDAAKVLKLTNALEKLQRIGNTPLGCIAAGRAGVAPE
jgi:hypothetical protein